MGSAIDTHLQCPRTLSRRAPDDYEPPFPMFVARADKSLEQVNLWSRSSWPISASNTPNSRNALPHSRP